MLGITDWVESLDSFILVSFIAQAIGGFGCGITATSSFSLIMSFNAADRERYIGYIEAANGMGLLLGPMIGALLYSIGGFYVPFFFFATCFILAYPSISYTLITYEPHLLKKDGNLKINR